MIKSFKINKEFEMKKILYFTADWCQPCKILSPIMEELSKSYSISLGQTYPIEKINIDENKELKNKYNINSIPTIIVLQDEIEKHRIIGIRSKKEYINSFEN